MQPTTSQRVTQCFALLGYAIFSLVVIGTLLELFCWVGLSAYHGIRQALHPAAVAGPLASEPWASEFLRQESVRQNVHKTFIPFRVWGAENWHGAFVNNDESTLGIVRRTINPTSPTCTGRSTRSVWIFGGSALYGTGVPDWGTLPSYLSRALNAAGPDCVIVTNFGVEGYVTNQEIIALSEQLKAGHHPDTVIFYDGANDSGAAAYALGASPLPYFQFPEVKDRVEGSISARFDFLFKSHLLHMLMVVARSAPIAPLRVVVTPRVAAALDNYEANLGFAKALSTAYGFKMYCFWQPSLYYGHKPLVPFEQQMVNTSNPWTDYWRPAVEVGYQEAAKRAAAKPGEFVFLGGFFDSSKDPMYLDMVHLDPQGNELVANYIAEYISNHS